MNNKTKEYIESLQYQIKELNKQLDQQSNILLAQQRYINSLEINQLVLEKKLLKKFDNSKYVNFFNKLQTQQKELTIDITIEKPIQIPFEIHA